MIGEIWGKVSEESKDLIQRMLIIEPRKRLSAEEVLAHEWFKLDLSQVETALQEVTIDLKERMSKKIEGTLGQPQLMKVENINEEILKKGLEILEIGNMSHTRSMFVSRDRYFHSKIG